LSTWARVFSKNGPHLAKTSYTEEEEEDEEVVDDANETGFFMKNLM
jgi:hypothetical protein